MKYWTGFLTAGIIGAITWALMRLAENFGELVDMVYPYVTRTAQNFLAQWSSGVDFCLWQMGVLVLGIFAVAAIVVIIVMKWNPVRWIGWALAGAALFYLLHTLVFGDVHGTFAVKANACPHIVSTHPYTATVTDDTLTVVIE